MRRRDQLKRLCKNRIFRTHRLTRKFCECICVEDETPVVALTPFLGCIVGSPLCGGRCVNTPTQCQTFYTNGDVVTDISGATFPFIGSNIFLDAEGTMQITDPFTIIGLTGCSYINVINGGEVNYICI